MGSGRASKQPESFSFRSTAEYSFFYFRHFVSCVFDKMWHQNLMSESLLENLFLVLTWHQSELQKYICWLVFSYREHFNFSREF